MNCKSKKEYSIYFYIMKLSIIHDKGKETSREQNVSTESKLYIKMTFVMG